MLFEPFQLTADVVTEIDPVKCIGDHVEVRLLQRIEEIVIGQFVTATVRHILDLIGDLSAHTFDRLRGNSNLLVRFDTATGGVNHLVDLCIKSEIIGLSVSASFQYFHRLPAFHHRTMSRLSAGGVRENPLQECRRDVAWKSASDLIGGKAEKLSRPVRTQVTDR